MIAREPNRNRYAGTVWTVRGGFRFGPGTVWSGTARNRLGLGTGWNRLERRLSLEFSLFVLFVSKKNENFQNFDFFKILRNF